jgi:hypothetical protein
MKNNVDLAPTINPGAKTADATGAGVDLSGYASAMAIVQAGTRTDGTHTPKLQESSDDATYTDVDSTDLEGSFSALTSNSVQRVGYKGAKRYIRVFVTVAGATTGCVFGAAIVRGEPAIMPLP